MLAPYGVLHAFSKLSLPVDTNHFPHVAKRNDRTQLSCKWSWYLSGFVACRTSTWEFSMPTASQSPKIRRKLAIKLYSSISFNLPVGQYPREKICELKSCCCSCRPSRRSHDLTVLSKPPVHNFEPSGLMSMHDAPSVWPWNCLTSVLLFRSQTAMLPSLQHEKQTLESGEMAKA